MSPRTNGGAGIDGETTDSIMENKQTDDNSWRFGPDWESGGFVYPRVEVDSRTV